MPKKRKAAETFEEFVGVQIDKARLDANLTQEELADAAGMPLTNLGRGIRGTRSFTIKEFTRVANALGIKPDEIIQPALVAFGGMTKLLDENSPMSAGVTSLEDHRAAKQREALKMSPESLEQMETRAATTDPELGSDEPELP